MSILAVLSQVLLLLFGLFLMIIVLLQRGRGGGLAGAFGGMGGQSAFGTKAGDVFTRITIVVAVIWVILAGGSGLLMRASSDSYARSFADDTAGVDTEAEEESAEGLQLGEEAALDELLESAGSDASAPAAGESTPADAENAVPSDAAEAPADSADTSAPPEEAPADNAGSDADSSDDAAAPPSNDPQK